MGLKDQLDTRREFKNGKTARLIWNGDVVIIPKMIDCSKKCIVMSYEESSLFCTLKQTDKNKHEIMRLCILITLSQNNMVYKGLFHIDMHQGNYGARKTSENNYQLVIYDFGQCANLKTDMRTALTESFFAKNYKLWLSAMCPDEYEAIMKECYIPNQSFEVNMKTTTGYLLRNDIISDHNVLSFCVGALKLTSHNNVVDRLLRLDGMEQYEDVNLYKNGYVQFLMKYAPYSDFDDLKRLFVKIDADMENKYV